MEKLEKEMISMNAQEIPHKESETKMVNRLFTPAPSITQISLTNASTISRKEWLHGNKQE